MTVLDVVQTDLVDRAAVARAILARAEEQTGTSAWVRPVLVPGADGAKRRQEHPAVVERVLPVDPALAGLLPSGGLERGSTTSVVGSTSLVLALLAEASRSGSWVAVVGMPRVGVLAAHQLGLDLDRMVLVPDPGPDAPLAVAALIDGMDVVVVGETALNDTDRRRLSTRARERSTVLLPTVPWPGAGVGLTVEAVRWDGLGAGHGLLRSRRLTVRRHGRGAAAQAWRGEAVLASRQAGRLAG